MCPAAAVEPKDGGEDEDGGGNRYSSLLFFSNHCGLCFCLAYVVIYGRNSTKRNIAMFTLSQGISHGLRDKDMKFGVFGKGS
jgi:hypothetical protein